MYDELKRSEDDNPTIGIVLCSDTDEDIARYSVLHGNEQLFASKYKLYLPTEEELRAEIETQKAMFYLQQEEKKESGEDIAETLAWQATPDKLRLIISMLPENEKELIKAHFYDGKSQSALAEEYGVNQSSISRRIGKILAKIKKL